MWSRRWRILALACAAVGVALALAFGYVAASDGNAYDAHAFWAARPYDVPADNRDAFLYSPPVLLFFRAVSLALPFPLFLQAWTAAIALGISLLAGPFTALVILTPQVATELTLANIHVFLAIVAVLGFRWPAMWSIALLTKVTPGIGLLWFAFRREWRPLAIAIGTTAAIALPTMLVVPDLWVAWVRVLVQSNDGTVHSSFGIPLAIRLVAAVALVYMGARRTWRWTVPLAAMLALPILWEVHSLSMLLGVLYVARQDVSRWWRQRAKRMPGAPEQATAT